MSEIKNNIEKLIFESDLSNYKISQETGIAQSTLSDIKKGKAKIGNIKLDLAEKLNEFYLKTYNQ